MRELPITIIILFVGVRTGQKEHTQTKQMKQHFAQEEIEKGNTYGENVSSYYLLILGQDKGKIHKATIEQTICI